MIADKRLVASEVWLLKTVPKNVIDQDRELSASRHPSLTHLNSLDLTKNMYSFYQKWLIRHFEITHDIDYAEKKPGFCKMPFERLKLNTLIQLYEARQLADHFGMPYDDYAYLCFKISRQWHFDKKLMPKDLANNTSLIQAVSEQYKQGGY